VNCLLSPFNTPLSGTIAGFLRARMSSTHAEAGLNPVASGVLHGDLRCFYARRSNLKV